MKKIALICTAGCVLLIIGVVIHLMRSGDHCSTQCVIPSGYDKNILGSYVYHPKGGFKEDTIKVQIADKKSFEVIDSVYARDNAFLYYEGEPLKGVDVETAEILSFRYVRDKKAVFFNGSAIEKADLDSFQIVPSTFGYLAKDKNYVYYAGEILESVDPSTFEVIDEDYSKDEAHVYYLREAIVGADPETFAMVPNKYSDGEYWIDEKNVYYKGKAIEGADLNSFEYIEGCYECFRDKNNLYYRSEVYIGNLEELFGE